MQYVMLPSPCEVHFIFISTNQLTSMYEQSQEKSLEGCTINTICLSSPELCLYVIYLTKIIKNFVFKMKSESQHQKNKYSSKILSSVISEQKVFEAKWLGLKTLDFKIGQTIRKGYEVAYRTTSKQNGITGINVIPVMKYKQKPTQIVFIANFRPACGKFVLQFPAGLLEDENYLQNAQRQLKEETGLIAYKFLELPQVNHCDPWKSDESGTIFIGFVDGDDPNAVLQQELESTQNIRIHKIPITDRITEDLVELSEKFGYAIEGKVYCFCLGIKQFSFLQQNKF